MVTKAKSKTGLRASSNRTSSATLSFTPSSARKVRELTNRASHQINQLRLLTPLFTRTERLLVPAGIKRMRDPSKIPAAQQEAGALLHVLNHELQLFIDRLTDTIAVLQVHVEEASDAST